MAKTLQNKSFFSFSPAAMHIQIQYITHKRQLKYIHAYKNRKYKKKKKKSYQHTSNTINNNQGDINCKILPMERSARARARMASPHHQIPNWKISTTSLS